MMPPDKIYIPLYPNYSLDGFHLADEWMYEPHKEVENVEYIHENTLLELLREKRNAITECSAIKEGKMAALSVIDFLIDKISKL